MATFEADVQALLSGEDALLANGVALVNVTDGDLNGRTFLIVDDGSDGFSVADDLVIELVGTSVRSDLSADWIVNSGA